MKKVRVQLQDFAGRDFGGEFEAVGVSMRDNKYMIHLRYCGPKSSKRLSAASLSIDAEVFENFSIATA